MKVLMLFLLITFFNFAHAKTVIGILEGTNEITLKSKSQGELKEIYFKEGDPVIEGDIIAELESEKEQIEMDMALNDFETAKKDFLKSEKLAEYISKDELLKKKNDYLKKENMFKLKDYNLKTKKFISPINGTFTRKYIKIGENVSSGAKSFEVIQYDELVIDLHIQAKYMNTLKIGNKLKFVQELDETQTFYGNVFFIGPVLDKASGTVNVKLKLINPKDKSGNFILRPGMTVRVSIE